MSTLRRVLASFFTLTKSRVEVIFAWPWFAAFGYLIAAKGYIDIKPLLSASFSILFLTLSTYIYNDVQDAPGDKLNPQKKQRPVAAGKVKESDALIFVSVFGIAGIILLFFLNIYSIIFGMIYYILFNVYSYRRIYLKKRFLLKELTITLGFPLTALVGIFAAGSFSLPAFLISLVLGVYAFLGQPVMTDASDMLEDKRYGIKTIAQITNWRTKIFLLIAAGAVFLLSVPAIYKIFDLSPRYLYFSIFVSIVYILTLFFMSRNIQNNLFKIRHLSHGYVLLMQVFFILAATG